MQNFLLVVFIFVFLLGITSALIYRKNTGKTIVIILIMMSINACIFFTILKIHDNTLRKEIKNVIASRNGEVVDIRKIQIEDAGSTPFHDEVSSKNLIYKVEYKKDNHYFIAWYRGVNTINDIHSQNPGRHGMGIGEKWIFIEGE
ncbi:hypothetical protein ACK8P5_08800 [Paenibacillus sp. EC2-1]|uniref:hypothetical protein n=1 Tax=Paenibacillus sp. EC2-1 TaxID=3388665 RepID=UPI003BEEE25C